MSVLPSETEVLIVGAGPVGLTLAGELRRRGLSCLLVDRLEEGANTSRAVGIQARTLEVLEPLGATEELLARGLRLHAARIRRHDQVLFTIELKDLPTPYRFVLSCPQNWTEEVLLGRLRAFGGEVVRPWRLQAMRAETRGVEADLEWQGAFSRVNASWIVACDGMHSTVREQAGIPFEGADYTESFILADCHLDWPFGRDEGSMFLAPEGLMVVVPLPAGDFRIVATLDEAPEKPSRDDVAALMDLRGPQAQRVAVHDVVWSSRFRIHHRVAQTLRKGRVLLCGDAAHVHSPAGGQGMNTGIQDAVALAEALAPVLQGGEEAALDEWARARRRVARKVVALTDRLTRAATLTSRPAQALRDVLLEFVGHFPAAKRAIAFNLAELDTRSTR